MCVENEGAALKGGDINTVAHDVTAAPRRQIFDGKARRYLMNLLVLITQPSRPPPQHTLESLSVCVCGSSDGPYLLMEIDSGSSGSPPPSPAPCSCTLGSATSFLSLA